MTIVDKKYGKLTEDQFKRLIRKLPEFRNESREVQEALRSASKEKLRELLGDGVWWAPVYELSLVQGVAFLVYVLGETDRIKAVSQLSDPQEVFLKEIEEDKDFEWNGGPGGAFVKADVIALTTALQRNILSIMIYKRSLSSLIAEAREGNDDALFNAIRLDRSVLSCPTAAMRISKAELLEEKPFFLRLRSALKGPSKKHWEGYRDLRYSLFVLRELGFDQFSDAQLEYLLVDVLKVYPDNYGARKNLRKQYYESKKIKAL
jgi:hypothetical protein